MFSRAIKVVVVTSLIACVWVAGLLAHCEIPCGIYDDGLRIQMIQEHITTIEKSMNKIDALSKESPVNYNQLIRWVTNKEEHANKIQHIVSQYFMTQRIKLAPAGDKAAQESYLKKLGLLHEILVYAMKAKQTTDQQYIAKLRQAVETFSDIYFTEAEKEHMKNHK